jgi:hypothetical protein
MAQEIHHVATIHAVDIPGNRFDIIESSVFEIQVLDRRTIRGTWVRRRLNLEDGRQVSEICSESYRLGNIVLRKVSMSDSDGHH